MTEQTTTENKTLECLECKNSTKLQDNLKEGDVVECEHCGIEYEITKVKDNGEYELEMIEEEK